MPLAPTRKFLFIGVVLGIAIGLALSSFYWPNQSDRDSEIEASEELPLPPLSEADRFWRMFPLPGEQGRVYVHVLQGAAESVNIVLLEVYSQGEQQNVHRRTVQRSQLSFESVFIWLQSGRKCNIIPETTWGGVHRDTGLEVTMEITDD